MLVPAVRNQVLSYLGLAAVAVVQYLIVRGRDVADTWFYLYAAVLFGVLAIATLLYAVVRGQDMIIRSMDERAAWLEARAMRWAYSASIIITYVVAFQQALVTGEIFNPATYLFGFMGAAWGVAWVGVNWRYR